ncbi:MAG: transglycosylase domain-containing protein [Patescibacteria group bacterium]
MRKIRIGWPKFRLPFSNPFGLKKIQARLFSKKPRSPKSVWKKIGKVALWGFGTFLLVLILMFAWFAKDLPTPGKIRNLVSASSTRLFDRNLKPLYTISGEKKRIIVDKEDIPDIVKQATIALEDKDFYHHHGLDFRGVARAVLFGGSRGGGSTINQQFIKNTVLSSERTIVRKAKEAILAIELEFLFSKDDILAMYLNEIPYGGNNYGVEAAAKSFFNKSVGDLSLAQAATLAALPQAPTTLSPYGPNTDRLIARRNLTLQLMADQGYITDEQAQKAQKTKLKVVARHDAIAAPHFVLYVKDWLVKHFTDELGDAQLAEQKVEEGGLTVVTTLDLKNQKIAEAAVANSVSSGALARASASNAGLVSIDPKRGEVLAMVGSVDYFQEQFGAYNIATAQRQPGSSFKPIIYATAFKEKYNPATTLFDLRTDFGNYIPNNFDSRFRGPVTIRQAIGNSLNIPAVKALALVGVDKALETSEDLGITTLTDKDRYGLSLALGGGEVKLVDMVTAYGVFANNGVLMPTTPVLKITDSDQKTLYDHSDPKDGRLVLDPQIAYQISDILSDVDAKRAVFTFSLPNLTLSDRPVASKTGTTNNYKDAWTMGYTPQIVTGVWAGNNDFTAMNRVGGSTVAAPIWDYYMERVHENLDVERFSRPDGIEEIAVDQLSNKLPVEGSKVITDIFARWQIPTEKDDVHVKVRVCKENGLLAGSDIPDELAQLKTFAYVQSEIPENPKWENPVRAWARQNGLDKRPPTEECTVSDSTKPSINITSPSNGQVVSGTFSMAASASSPSGIKQVDFYIDNSKVASDKKSPYKANYNSNNLSNGTHQLTAIVTSKKGSTASDTISFSVSKDTTAPGNVTDYIGFQGPGNGNVTLSWTDPTNSDLDKIKIYIYLDSSNVLVQTIEVDKGVGNYFASSLLSGVAYRFTARSIDFIGNESSGVSVVLTPT